MPGQHIDLTTRYPSGSETTIAKLQTAIARCQSVMSLPVYPVHKLSPATLVFTKEYQARVVLAATCRLTRADFRLTAHKRMWAFLLDIMFKHKKIRGQSDDSGLSLTGETLKHV
ncbi:uncharacterized protein SSYIS1_17610 [Serratia symbiotica]|nr:uncharacterized protein SSYIS1_17610 [Serratia symbiotica]